VLGCLAVYGNADPSRQIYLSADHKVKRPHIDDFVGKLGAFAPSAALFFTACQRSLALVICSSLSRALQQIKLTGEVAQRSIHASLAIAPQPDCGSERKRIAFLAHLHGTVAARSLSLARICIKPISHGQANAAH
jgi:hypothetical protein